VLHAEHRGQWSLQDSNAQPGKRAHSASTSCKTTKKEHKNISASAARSLCVGEALVGNEAVDQLSKFNERLSDLSANVNQTRLIDGIVLSKFDTVDDKVGAALSMAGR